MGEIIWVPSVGLPWSFSLRTPSPPTFLAMAVEGKRPASPKADKTGARRTAKLRRVKPSENMGHPFENSSLNSWQRYTENLASSGDHPPSAWFLHSTGQNPIAHISKPRFRS